MAYGAPCPLSPGDSFALDLEIPETDGWPVCDLGLEVVGSDYSAGSLLVDRIDYSGQPRYHLTGNKLPSDADGQVLGWIVDADQQPFFPVNDSQDWQPLARNVGRGHLVTGTLDWRDYHFKTDLVIHCADKAGILIRYQGLRRYLALVKTGSHPFECCLTFGGITQLNKSLGVHGCIVSPAAIAGVQGSHFLIPGSIAGTRKVLTVCTQL